MSRHTEFSQDSPFDDSLSKEDSEFHGIEPTALVRLRRDLSEIPGLYSKCEVVHADPSRLLRERVSGSRHADIPLDEDAMTLRADIVRVLTLWADLVVAERRCAAPHGRDVKSLASYLGEHVEWFSDHPAACDFLEEISHLAEATREYLRVKYDRRRELGACIRPGCGARMFAYLAHVSDSPAGIRCEAGHSWATTQWLALASELATGTQEVAR